MQLHGLLVDSGFQGFVCVRKRRQFKSHNVGPFWVAVCSLGYSRMDALSLSNDAVMGVRQHTIVTSGQALQYTLTHQSLHCCPCNPE
jgi:hypothetical protein